MSYSERPRDLKTAERNSASGPSGSSRVSRDKIRIMADLAIYEKKHKEDVFRVDRFYKSDYVFWHILLAAVRFTFCFLFCFALLVVFNSETIFYNINLSGITETLKKVLIYYAAGLGIYCLIAAVVYSVRYKRARKGILYYASRLRRLARKYHYDEDD